MSLSIFLSAKPSLRVRKAAYSEPVSSTEIGMVQWLREAGHPA